MVVAIAPRTLPALKSGSGMCVELNANGSLRQITRNGVVLCLFPGNEIEGGLANVYLRRRGETLEWIPLLGPASPTRFHPVPSDGRLVGVGEWDGLRYALDMTLSEAAPAWFVRIRFSEHGGNRRALDLTYVQDVALAPYGAVRTNEFYVSQYVDHTPLTHPKHGVMVASRQNQAVDGRNPWCLIGSLREGVSFATDAMQFHGLAARAGDAPVGLCAELPGKRLQHEHSLVVIRDATLVLDANGEAEGGFFGVFSDDHPPATSSADVERIEQVIGTLGVPARPEPIEAPEPAFASRTLFSHPRFLRTTELEEEDVRALFGGALRHEERDTGGALLSFFHSTHHHVVLRRKELAVRRPHGHLLRSGTHLTPDESALTSTAWMTGVFHSMVTQGHVSINRFLSTTRSYLSLFRSHGQRVFVELDGDWQLLDVPSAFEMTPTHCRWIYRHPGGEIEVRAGAKALPHELTLDIEVTAGAPARFLVTHHLALDGDDGAGPARPSWSLDGRSIRVRPAPGSELARRFPEGAFVVEAGTGTELSRIAGDEVLFADGRSRGEPFLCLVTAIGQSASFRLRGELIPDASRTDAASLAPRIELRSGGDSDIARLFEMVPWYVQNAFVHYLSPRGLEQYSGGGWGTRDICQGPVELLFALGRPAAVRDLLLRVFSQQNPDGDWPQWFMFFERERNNRPGDSHGDIAYWPLLVLAQYLLATRDASVLTERVRFFDARGAEHGDLATISEHAARALGLIRKRVIPGTSLAAYWHGDWNDSLQPADPRMRERLCSAWTVTLHHQTLRTLGTALRTLGTALHTLDEPADAETLEDEARAVRTDIQRRLIVDGVLTGYALFEEDGRVRYLLHPRDEVTGVRFSSLAMIHAILEDLLTPEQAHQHLRLLANELSGPDGVRLFDRPLRYRGGPQMLFQRAESATFFGREIGLMYTHAHLRYAQALARVGDADAFFRALSLANPIGLESRVPSATRRQSNCYYSSSDAAFADRYDALDHYAGVLDASVPLDGGWRVYSSGPGIAFGLIVGTLLGLSVDADVVSLDPVLPPAFGSLTIATTLLEHDVEVRYRIGNPGSGVRAATLNACPLPLEYRHNPYRRGAATVSRATFVDALHASENVLVIDIGDSPG